MRSRIYEIKLHFPERLPEGKNPTVTVYSDRSVEVSPAQWAADQLSPTRTDAAKILSMALGFDYDIERRFL